MVSVRDLEFDLAGLLVLLLGCVFLCSFLVLVMLFDCR